MARTEITEKRTARSKTFLNDDGSFTFEAGGEIAHHLKAGVFVDTDCTWKNSANEYLTGEFPGQVKINKGTLAVTFLPLGQTVPFSLAPQSHNRKAEPVYSETGISIPGLWTGVDCDIFLSPRGAIIQYTKTVEPCTNPAWTLTGDLAASYVSSGTEEYTNFTTKEQGIVPRTVQYGALTLDFSVVPVGAVVR